MQDHWHGEGGGGGLAKPGAKVHSYRLPRTSSSAIFRCHLTIASNSLHCTSCQRMDDDPSPHDLMVRKC